MARQRCVIHAIIDSADPVTLLSKYQELAATTKDIVETDIPQSALDDFVNLGFSVKDASVRSVVFDESLIKPAYPDYAKMRRLVDQALTPPSQSTSTSASSSSSSSAASSSSSAPSTAGTSASPTKDPAADVSDACAYNPRQAAEQLAAGKPPTKRR
jgi:hypothetical protein